MHLVSIYTAKLQPTLHHITCSPPPLHSKVVDSARSHPYYVTTANHRVDSAQIDPFRLHRHGKGIDVSHARSIHSALHQARTGSERANLPDFTLLPLFPTRPERKAPSVHTEPSQPTVLSAEFLTLSQIARGQTSAKNLKMKGSASNAINIDRSCM
uniref:AlNc14C405G11410 protein n=1 Tax=Albugo laibachii Nc14 TaxID=890382 RepID=F0WZ00_9STRA|nr:AlNc14C405G11410 [Albugo laibachii Nc14]|eukprot:CCA26714.1 AlNc14C405G11410 [Albugo laibachii Nc14]